MCFNSCVIHSPKLWDTTRNALTIYLICLQRCQDMPMLLRRMLWEFADPLRALRLLSNLRILLCILLVILYVASPFDVIPESASNTNHTSRLKNADLEYCGNSTRNLHFDTRCAPG